MLVLDVMFSEEVQMASQMEQAHKQRGNCEVVSACGSHVDQSSPIT